MMNDFKWIKRLLQFILILWLYELRFYPQIINQLIIIWFNLIIQEYFHSKFKHHREYDVIIISIRFNIISIKRFLFVEMDSCTLILKIWSITECIKFKLKEQWNLKVKVLWKMHFNSYLKRCWNGCSFSFLFHNQ